MRVFTSMGLGILAVTIAGCVVKGVLLLIEITQGQIAIWATYPCAVFVIYLIGNAIREIKRDR